MFSLVELWNKKYERRELNKRYKNNTLENL